MIENKFSREVWRRGDDGENVIFSNEVRRTPFPRLEIGSPVTVEGAEPRSFTVIGTIGSNDDERHIVIIT